MFQVTISFALDVRPLRKGLDHHQPDFAPTQQIFAYPVLIRLVIDVQGIHCLEW